MDIGHLSFSDIDVQKNSQTVCFDILANTIIVFDLIGIQFLG